MELAAAVAARLEVAGAVEGEADRGRVGEVGGAGDQPGHLGGDRVLDLVARPCGSPSPSLRRRRSWGSPRPSRRAARGAASRRSARRAPVALGFERLEAQHPRRRAPRRRACRPPRRSARGRRRGRGTGRPRASRRRAWSPRTSSSPSGSPWAAAVSCLCGEPQPMWLSTMIRVGRVGLALELLEGAGEQGEVVGVADPGDVPAVAHEAGGDVVGVGEVGFAVDRDVVVVVDPAEVVELRWPASEAASLETPSIRQPSPAERVDVEVEEVGVGRL